VPIEGLHTETGPGVYEVAIAFSEALERPTAPSCSRPAPRKSASASASCPASWPSGNQQLPGCSGHIHQSLSDGKHQPVPRRQAARKMSALRELPGRPGRLPDGVRADVLAHHQQLQAPGGRLLGAGQADLGLDNRTASFRVIAGSPKATRLETRCPGADVNPYLAMAAVIAAGLHGVEKGLKLTAPPITGTNAGGRAHPARAAHADRDDPRSSSSRPSPATGWATPSSTTSPPPANGNGASGRTR
jgi:glutamine synthetase